MPCRSSCPAMPSRSSCAAMPCRSSCPAMPSRRSCAAMPCRSSCPAMPSRRSCAAMPSRRSCAAMPCRSSCPAMPHLFLPVENQNKMVEVCVFLRSVHTYCSYSSPFQLKTFCRCGAGGMWCRVTFFRPGMPSPRGSACDAATSKRR